MSPPKAGRLVFLDSIRGIAALMVVVHHCALNFGQKFLGAHVHHSAVHSARDLLLYFCTRFLFLGRSSVIMFFVLSGFVLTQSLAGHSTPYLAYVVRRIFRIYPLFLVVVVASYALHTLIDGPQSVDALIGHLAMEGTVKTIHLDPPVWSLDHEMRISILFPFLFWCVARFLKKSVWIALIVSVCCTVAIRASTGSYAEGFNDSTVHATWLETGYFIFFFALGSYMAIRWQAVVESALFLPKGAKVLLFAVLCFFLLIGDGGGKAFVSSAVDYLRGFSSAGIIALAAASQRLAAALNHGVLTWLGRISFSLYLVHVPTILSVAFACGSAWSPISLSALAILLSLFIATLISAAVEYPCIKLGKSVAALFQPARAQQRFQEVPLVRQLER